MNKILIRLYVPSIEQTFDLFVPTDMAISILTGLLVDGVVELCEGQFHPVEVNSQRGILVMREPQYLLNPKNTLADYGAEDGTCLVLF